MKINEESTLISLPELSKEVGIRPKTIVKFYKKEKDGAIKQINNRNYISKEDAELIKESLLAIQWKHGFAHSDKDTDYIPYFIDVMTYYCRKYPNIQKTISLYETWAKVRFKKSARKNLAEAVKPLLNACHEFFPLLGKELFEYNDKELLPVLKSIGNEKLRYIAQFVNHCKTVTECLYSGDYKYKHHRETSKNKKVDKGDAIYTKEEWARFTNHALDVDKHFERAFESKSYANTWLFCLLHFSLAWRRSDMFEFKPVYIESIGIDSFEWFNSNTFTLEMAQDILRGVKRSTDNQLIGKNKERAVFVVPFIFEMPTALAFVLSELHRRSSKKKQKLIGFVQTLDTIFNEDDMPKFTNKKSNKTLMTYSWETAVQNGKGVLAYWLGGFSRSHTKNISGINPITQVYLITENTDASVENMALHSFERGIFGWQIKVIIDALNGNKPINLQEMTQTISLLNKTYSPVMVDSLSQYAATRHEESHQLLQELMAVPRGELKDKLKEISKLQSPSFLDHSQCLVGIKNCPYMNVEYNLEAPCLSCRYRIDTNYIMDTVNVKIFSLLEKLKNTPDNDSVTRIKFTHMIKTLAYILMDFKRAYDQYDVGYIRSFVDIERLQKEMTEIGKVKFLELEEAKA